MLDCKLQAKQHAVARAVWRSKISSNSAKRERGSRELTSYLLSDDRPKCWEKRGGPPLLFGAMSNAAERIAFPRKIEPRTRVSIVKLSFDSDCQGSAASCLLTESGTQFEIERYSGKRQREKGRKQPSFSSLCRGGSEAAGS